MKKNIKTLVVVLIWISFLPPLHAVQVTHQFIVSSYTPPSAITLQDGQGRKSGADFNMLFSSKGLQEGGISRLKQIPGSQVDQQNLADENNIAAGPASPATSWIISIENAPMGDYTLFVKGLTEGIQSIRFEIMDGVDSTKDVITTLSLFVSPNSLDSINVALNPSARTLKYERVIEKDQLLQDTQSACKAGLLSSGYVCKTLQALAKSIQKNLSQNDKRRAEEKVRVYLGVLERAHRWGEKGSRDDWADFKVHDECHGWRRGEKVFAKDPAYTILKEEAQAMLASLKKKRPRS